MLRDSLRKNYRELGITVLAVLIAGYFCTATFGYVPRIPLPATTSGIHVGLAFDYNAAPTALTGKVDYVWGATQASLGTIATDAYMPYARDAKDTYVAGHDLATWQKNHPDWIVYRCDGKTPADPFLQANGQPEAVPLDITNPAVRAYQMQYAGNYLDAGYGGIAFDNLEATNFGQACGVYKRNAQGQLVWTLLGYDNATKYQNDIIAWAHAMHDSIKATYPGVRVDGNVRTLNWPSVGAYGSLMQYLDLDYDESGVRGVTDAAWQKTMQSYDYDNANNKAFVIGGQTGDTAATDTPAAELWVTANYLLAKGNYSYMNIYAGSQTEYGSFVNRAVYSLPIGQPTGARYASQGVYMRDYSGGLVLVNPSSSRSYTVKLASPLVDAAGHSAQTVSMTPTSGLVLYKPVVATTPSSLTAAAPKTAAPNVVAATGTSQTGSTAAPSGKAPAATTNQAANNLLTKGVDVSVPTTSGQAKQQIYGGVVAIMLMTSGLIAPTVWPGSRRPL